MGPYDILKGKTGIYSPLGGIFIENNGAFSGPDPPKASGAPHPPHREKTETAAALPLKKEKEDGRIMPSGRRSYVPAR